MENFIKKHMLLFILLISIILPLNSGCSKIFKGSREKEDKQVEEGKKSPPKTLTGMEDITDEMIGQIQEVKDKRVEIIMVKKDEVKEQSTEDKPKEEKPPTIDWDKLEKDVEKLQSSWSNYVNDARKDGATQELIKEYEDQLDILTTLVMSHKESSLLKATNDLYQYYPKFLNLYKHQAPPDLKEMKYHIQDIIIAGENGDWIKKAKSIDEIKQAWETAKSRMEKPDQDLNNKVQASMDSFIKSVKQRNIQLVKIKGKIFISNLEEIK